MNYPHKNDWRGWAKLYHVAFYRTASKIRTNVYWYVNRQASDAYTEQHNILREMNS